MGYTTRYDIYKLLLLHGEAAPLNNYQRTFVEAVEYLPVVLDIAVVPVQFQPRNESQPVTIEMSLWDTFASEVKFPYHSHGTLSVCRLSLMLYTRSTLVVDSLCSRSFGLAGSFRRTHQSCSEASPIAPLLSHSGLRTPETTQLPTDQHICYLVDKAFPLVLAVETVVNQFHSFL